MSAPEQGGRAEARRFRRAWPRASQWSTTIAPAAMKTATLPIA